MSRIYFHSKDDEAEVLGSERAYCSEIVNDLGCAALGIAHDDPAMPTSLSRTLLKDAFPLGVSKERPGWIYQYRDSLRLYLTVGNAPLTIGDRHLEAWHVLLNTAITLGPDPVRLMARVHATCEIHGYVEGHNRAWLADIITDGLDKYLLRDTIYRQDDTTHTAYPTGWRDVIVLLRSGDKDAVVMSYSVTDGFPNVDVAQYADDDEKIEHWDTLPDSEQWNLAMQGLRSGSYGTGLEMSPGDFATQGFGDGVDAFMLLHEISEQR